MVTRYLINNLNRRQFGFIGSRSIENESKTDHRVASSSLSSYLAPFYPGISFIKLRFNVLARLAENE